MVKAQRLAEPGLPPCPALEPRLEVGEHPGPQQSVLACSTPCGCRVSAQALRVPLAAGLTETSLLTGALHSSG